MGHYASATRTAVARHDVDRPPGYFSRVPWLPDTKFAFTNFGVSLGLQATQVWPERVERLNTFFESWRSDDEYDREAITWSWLAQSHFPGSSSSRSAIVVQNR